MNTLANWQQGIIEPNPCFVIYSNSEWYFMRIFSMAFCIRTLPSQDAVQPFHLNTCNLKSFLRRTYHNCKIHSQPFEENNCADPDVYHSCPATLKWESWQSFDLSQYNDQNLMMGFLYCRNCDDVCGNYPCY